MVLSTFHRKMRSGFSLVELVIVIVIIGVIAAIAIPRVSRASRGAGESALASNLAVLRNAIELYASEHNGVYPGAKSAGAGADANSEKAFTYQLTRYTDTAGDAVEARDDTHQFGPYLRKGIPPLSVGTGSNRNSTEVAIDTVNNTPVVTAGTAGWVYNPKTGEIIANTSERNESDTKDYNEY